MTNVKAHEYVFLSGMREKRARFTCVYTFAILRAARFYMYSILYSSRE